MEYIVCHINRCRSNHRFCSLVDVPLQCWGLSSPRISWKCRTRIYIAWIYLHLPLVVGLVSTATGIRYVVSTAWDVVLPQIGEWLICGSVPICLFSIGAIQFTTASALEPE